MTFGTGEGGETWDELAAWLQEEHNIVCDSRTIRRRFADADVADFKRRQPLINISMRSCSKARKVFHLMILQITL